MKANLDVGWNNDLQFELCSCFTGDGDTSIQHVEY